MKNIESRNWIGIILIIVGGLLVIDNYKIVDVNLGKLLFSWHSLFIIIGAIILAKSKNNVLGIILLVLGIFGTARFFFLPFLHLSFRDFWPLIIIIIGLYIIFRRNGSSKNKTCQEQNFNNIKTEYNSSNQSSSSDFINDNTVLTSSRKIIASQNFRGGKINVLMGSIELDLSQSRLSPGESNLEISIVFGSCTITVPRNWKIITNISSVFGGFEDKRFIVFNETTSEGVLVITGTVLFAGGEILSI